MSQLGDSIGLTIANKIIADIASESPSVDYQNMIKANWKYISNTVVNNIPGGIGIDAYLSQLQMNPGIIIPMYVYPSNIFTNTDYETLAELKKQYRNVPLVVILNPGWGTGGVAGGPGSVVDGNYKYAIKKLKGAGAICVGYVSTAYGPWASPGRVAANVYADVDLWKTLYPDIDGIFFDEQPNDWIADVDNASADALWPHVQQYLDYKNYCKNLLLSPVIGNPGADCPEVWFRYKAMDIIVTYENSGWPDTSTIKGGTWAGSHRDYPQHMRANLVYNVGSYNEANLLTMAKYSGLVYVTNDVMDNPWDTLSPHISNMFSSLSKKPG
jgi:hypothetical protein